MQRPLRAPKRSFLKKILSFHDGDSDLQQDQEPKLTEYYNSILHVEKEEKADPAVKIAVDARPVSDNSILRSLLISLDKQEYTALLSAAAGDAILNTKLTALAETTIALVMMSREAKGNKLNFEAYAELFKRTLCCLNSNGTDLHSGYFPMLDCITNLGNEVLQYCAQCSNKGWLYHIIEAEDVSEHLEANHSKIISFLKLNGLVINDTKVPESRYMCLSKSLKSKLSDLGQGSLQRGLIFLKNDLRSRHEVALLLDVSDDEVLEEVVSEPDFNFSTLFLDSNHVLRELECERVFREYASEELALIQPHAFEELLKDLDLLERVPSEKSMVYARTCLVNLDSDFDGMLNLNDFRSFYLDKPTTEIRSYMRCKIGLKMEKKIKKTFDAYVKLGKGRRKENFRDQARVLDNLRFSKLCRDCGFVDDTFLAQHVDVVFMSCTRGNRSMDFDQFLLSLIIIADRSKNLINSIALKLSNMKGPILQGTQPDDVPLHDDKLLYTGVYARGGPDLGAVVPDLKELVHRGGSSSHGFTHTPSSTPKKKTTKATKAESPKLATRGRVSSSGPTTPGRGASLAAVEARHASTENNIRSPKSQPAAFGRCHTPRSALLAHATKRGSRCRHHERESIKDVATTLSNECTSPQSSPASQTEAAEEVDNASSKCMQLSIRESSENFMVIEANQRQGDNSSFQLQMCARETQISMTESPVSCQFFFESTQDTRNNSYDGECFDEGFVRVVFFVAVEDPSESVFD